MYERIAQTNFSFYFNIILQLRPVLTLHKMIRKKPPSQFGEEKKKIDNYPVQELTIRNIVKENT